MTQDELKELLHYNQQTGIFTWLKITSKSKYKFGDELINICKHGYLRVKLNKKSYKLHRLAWLYVYGYMPNDMIDHINGIKTDNRICNLREATNTQNQWNRKNFGVTWNKDSQKWCARISVNNKRIHLGYFDDRLKAHEAYLKAKGKHHKF